MADIAVVGLELDTSKLEAQARRAEEWFQSVEKAADKVDASARKAGAGAKRAITDIKQLGQALSQLDLPGGAAASKLLGLAGAMRNVSASVPPAAIAVTGFGIAAAAVATQIVSMAVEGAKLADKMGATAKKTGETYEQIQKLEKGGRNLTSQLSALGAVLDGKVIEAASRSTDQFALLDKQWDALTIRIAADLNPALTEMGKLFQDLLGASSPFARELAANLGLIVSTATAGIRAIQSLVGELEKVPGFKQAQALRKIAFPSPQTLIDSLRGAVGAGDLSTINPPAPPAQSRGRSAAELLALIAPNVREPKATRGGGGAEQIDSATRALLNTIDVAAKLGRQTVPQLVDTLIDAQDDIQRLSQTLAVLSAGGYKTAKTMEELAKAQETLRQAQEKFFKSTGDQLTEQLRKVSLAQQTGSPPGVPILNGIPGPGGWTPDPGRFLAAAQRNYFGIGVGQTFSGGLPGQSDPGQAPDPFGGRLVGLKQQFFGRNSANGERIQGAGEQITQDFLTGLLMGQPDVRRAGENIAFFFADYFARKMTENLVKAFDPLFDVIGNAFSNLFSKIFGKIAGGIFGGIGGAAGGAASGFFLASGGPISSGRGAIVGESGPEFFVPQSNGFIVNQQQAAAAVGGGSIQVTNYFNISAPEGRIDRRSLDQVAESSSFALSRAQRLRGS